MDLAIERPLIRCAPHSALISVAGHAPDLLGVGLEERVVQFPAEPVDEELLEGASPAGWETARS